MQREMGRYTIDYQLSEYLLLISMPWPLVNRVLLTADFSVWGLPKGTAVVDLGTAWTDESGLLYLDEGGEI